MGKIRVSTLGDAEAEKKQKDEAQKRRLAKKMEKDGTKAAQKSEEKKENKKSREQKPETKPAAKNAEKEEVKKEPKKTSKPKKTVAHVRSERYSDLSKLVDRTKTYPVGEALTLAKQTSKTTFTGTIEAHFNLTRTLKLKNTDGVKVERKFPLAHAVLGKSTDPEKTLGEKFEQVLKVVGRGNIKKIVINASMGPGIKVEIV